MLYINKKLPEEGENLLAWLYRLYKEDGIPSTYKKFPFNKKNLQCKAKKKRSFDDLYELCITYYPKLTKARFAKKLKYLMRDLLPQKVSFIFCPDVKAWVIYNGTWSSGGDKYMFNNLLFNYHNSINKIYDSGNKETSFVDILILMGYSEEKIKDKLKIKEKKEVTEGPDTAGGVVEEAIQEVTEATGGPIPSSFIQGINAWNRRRRGR